MKSVTKANVTHEQIEKAVKKFFGENPKSCRELNDGCYNISYLIVLNDDREVVMKIAPSNDIEILTYEKDIIKTEILFYKLAEQHTDIKVPKIIGEDFSGEIISSPYYFMTKIEGTPLNKVKGATKRRRRPIYKTLAEYMAKLHNIKGEEYGYITMTQKCSGKGCLNSLLVSVESVIEDAHRKGIKLPFKEEDIYNVFKSAQKAFDEVEYPALTHYDLWDGNIFVKENNDTLEVTGVIDFERGFYACPAADFCQIMHMVDLKRDQYFLEEYNKHANKKLEYSNALMARTWAYRFYLFLIMHVECDYRDVEGSFSHQKLWVAAKIKGVYRKFKKWALKANK